MTHPPLVSIGVPVYNGEQCIKNALESLVTQSYRNLEIIISDNASTDLTAEICREFVARDPRVRYQRNVVNIGLTANFRKVLNLATGEFFTWACADDIRPPDAVENLVAAFLRNPHAVMSHGPVIAAPRDVTIEISNKMDLAITNAAQRVRIFTKNLRHNAILYGLYRRRELREAGFGDHYGQDYLLCLQMCLAGQVAYVESPMIIYREKNPLPSPDPMGPIRPLTLLALLRGSTNYKGLKVLFLGSYYLLNAEEVNVKQRIVATTAFLWTFGWRYHHRLAKDLLFLLSSPLAWLSSLTWKLSQLVPGISRLGERVKAVLTRA